MVIVSSAISVMVITQVAIMDLEIPAHGGKNLYRKWKMDITKYMSANLTRKDKKNEKTSKNK